MWPLCTANNPLWLLVPYLIGLLSGWWAWGRLRSETMRSVRNGGGNGNSAKYRKRPTPTATVSPGLGDQGFPRDVDDLQTLSDPQNFQTAAVGLPVARDDAPDNLMIIRGIGPTLNSMLRAIGITRYDQIASWNQDMIAHVDQRLGAFAGRIERDNWVEQARLLASGQVDEFHTRFADY